MMPVSKRTGKKAKRAVKWALGTLSVLLVGLVAWVAVVPMATSGAVTTYEAYQTRTGDISTVKSFSATLSVKKAETFASGDESTVRELYVTSGQSVQEGDPLVLLSTGELFSASFDGVVNEIRVKVGDWLWPNFTVVQVCDLTHLLVSMDVDEYDVKTLSVGQACTVSVISLGVDFDTVIAHINRVSQSQGTVAFYAVTCELTVPETILPGMQATVTLPDRSVTGVTTLPMAALAFDDERKPYVLLADASGAYTRQVVETGLSDGMTVEITGGLTPGQTVYAESDTQSVQAGLTLTDVYTFLFGQKTVVNDMSTRGGSNFQPPEGMPQTGEADMLPLADGTAQAAEDGQATMPDGTAVATDVPSAGGQATATPAPSGADTQAAGTAVTTDATGSATQAGSSQRQRPEPQTGNENGEASDDAQ